MKHVKSMNCPMVCCGFVHTQGHAMLIEMIHEDDAGIGIICDGFFDYKHAILL